jgi:hypothetical protein
VQTGSNGHPRASTHATSVRGPDLQTRAHTHGRRAQRDRVWTVPHLSRPVQTQSRVLFGILFTRLRCTFPTLRPLPLLTCMQCTSSRHTYVRAQRQETKPHATQRRPHTDHATAIKLRATHYRASSSPSITAKLYSTRECACHIYGGVETLGGSY